MSPTLHELITLARQAGEILCASLGKQLQVDFKGVINPVSDADQRSEQLLLSYIRQHYPGDRIMAEESGEQAGSNGHHWYIDPLDGTVNYVHGIPFFSISIAYAEAGELILGVVYDPTREECFSAERGKGAWLNGQPIHPARANDLDHALLVTGFPYEIRTLAENNLDNHNHFALHSQGVRRFGSAALELCYVACGRFDGFWEFALSAWDIAAGALVALEAGAVVTDIAGEPFAMPGTSILAANERIHALMLRELHRVRAHPPRKN